MAGRDLAREVTPAQATVHGDGATRVHAIDTGIKGSIVRQLVARGAQVTLHPCSRHADELLATDADLIFLANGPGDPAALGHIVATVRELVGRRPVWGICLGHQLLCQAVGLETYKLPFGHRGANHPVKDLTTGRIEITSQNHGFAVTPPGGARGWTPTSPCAGRPTSARPSSRTSTSTTAPSRGCACSTSPPRRSSTTPRPGPGPHDARHLFDRFLAAAR